MISSIAAGLHEAALTFDTKHRKKAIINIYFNFFIKFTLLPHLLYQIILSITRTISFVLIIIKRKKTGKSSYEFVQLPTSHIHLKQSSYPL